MSVYLRSARQYKKAWQLKGDTWLLDRAKLRKWEERGMEHTVDQIPKRKEHHLEYLSGEDSRDGRNVEIEALILRLCPLDWD